MTNADEQTCVIRSNHTLKDPPKEIRRRHFIRTELPPADKLANVYERPVHVVRHQHRRPALEQRQRLSNLQYQLVHPFPKNSGFSGQRLVILGDEVQAEIRQHRRLN